MINDAYSVENGSSGMCFIKEGSVRLGSPTAGSLLGGYQEGRVFRVAQRDTGKIIGATYWELRDLHDGNGSSGSSDCMDSSDSGDSSDGAGGGSSSSSGSGGRIIYFGPYAVSPSFQGRGVGHMMLAEVERLGREHKCSGIDIEVVNVRTNLLSMYRSLGYEPTGTAPFPSEGVPSLSRPAADIHMVTMRRSLH